MPRERRRTPTFLNTYPSQLATAEELKADGLHPAKGQLPAALLKLKGPGRESLSALYTRADATAIVER